ncbi:MAG: glycosyltransferase family 1 protein [Bacteroidota bacterium]
MKIGFDAKRLFHNFTGLGNYSRSLIRNLSQYANEDIDIHLYTPKTSLHQRLSYFRDNYPVHTNADKKILWRTKRIVSDLLKDKMDIYHGLSHEIPWGIGRKGIKTLVSMHDLIFLRYPDFYPLIDRRIYDWKFRYAAKHADQVLAISESTKADLVSYYNISPQKVQVLYQACDEQFYHLYEQDELEKCLEKHKLPAQYLLYVGSITERKNLLGLVQAIELLPSSLQIPLVILGQGKAYKAKVQEYIERKALGKLFVFCEDVPFADFPHIYQAAKALIYPSFFEGFGIPIIEALWSKTPVICSSTSSMPEAGGPDSLYINPAMIEDIAVAIQRLLEDEQLPNEMREKGYEYVQKFHGQKLSLELLEVYKHML